MPQQTRDVAGRQQALCLLKVLSHANTLARRLRAQPAICLPELRDHGLKISAAGPRTDMITNPARNPTVHAGALPNCVPARPQHDLRLHLQAEAPGLAADIRGHCAGRRLYGICGGSLRSWPNLVMKT